MKRNRLCCMLLLMVLLVASLAVCVSAAESTSYVWDQDQLLTGAEASQLAQRLKTISTSRGVTVVVVTASSLGGKSAEAYADDFYDENRAACGWSEDGVLLLICLESRDWHISTVGKGIRIFSESALDQLESHLVPRLRRNQFASAFTVFAEDCDAIIHSYFAFPWGRNLVIALVIGLAAALLVTLSMKSKLKSVRMQSGARSYVRQGSMHVTEQSDLPLYVKVTSRAIPKPSSSSSGRTHVSSSGRSHGGRGGKF